MGTPQNKQNSTRNSTPIDTTGYANKSAEILNANKGKNFIDRAVTNSPLKLSTEGGYMTHRMSYGSDDKGNNRAYPEVVQKKGDTKLTKLSPKEASDYARKTGENANLGNDKNFADYFTTVGYKQNMGDNVKKDAMNDYVKSTNGRIKKK